MLDKIVEQLDKCEPSTTFRYDKETGTLFEVEADVWARIGNGVEICLKPEESVAEKLDKLDVYYDNDYFGSNRKPMLLKEEVMEVVRGMEDGDS